jgi:hypothetical protein
MREKRFEKLKYDILKPHAHRFDVDPAGDYMRPGNSPPERAFQVLSCSLEMLIYLGDNAFPARDRSLRKKGGKWMRQALLFEGGNASMLLAHAVPALMARMDGRLSVDEPNQPFVPAEDHLRLLKTVSSFYALGKNDDKFIEQCDSEFRVMETHEPRDAVREGEAAPNAYSEALLRGENPDDDPELVRMQREYARDFFIDRATFKVAKKGLDSKDRVIVHGKLARFVDLEEPEATELRARVLAAWREGTAPYREYALLDSKN